MPSQDAQQARPGTNAREPLYQSVEDVARQLKVSPRWLADQCRDGLVEHVHIARKRKFTPAQVEKLLAKHTVKPADVDALERSHARAVRRVQRERAQRNR
jgi:hypothetical protein